jgi:hypothetical protein
VVEFLAVVKAIDTRCTWAGFAVFVSLSIAVMGAPAIFAIVAHSFVVFISCSFTILFVAPFCRLCAD